MKEKQKTNTINNILTSEIPNYSLLDNSYLGETDVQDHLLTTTSIDEESNFSYSNNKKAEIVDLSFVTPISLSSNSIVIPITRSTGTKFVNIYTLKADNITTLISSTGYTIQLKKNVLVPNKFTKFADLEYVVLYFILRLTGKHIDLKVKDKKGILKSINSFKKPIWKTS